MKGIALFSGGLDSTLVLLKLLEEGHEVVPMFVDYNQWSREGEFNAFVRVRNWVEGKISGKYNYNTPPGVLASYGTLLQYIKIGIGLATFDGKVGSVWGRNIALVGLAAMWAYINGNDYEFIALGLHRGDVGPDCKPGEFDTSLHDSLLVGTKGQLGLILPIRDLTIEDIGKELAKFGKELFDLTYSCYWHPPCGYKSTNEDYRCPGCRRKVVAMKAAAEGDSGLYEYFQQRLFNLPNCQERTYQSPLAERTGY